MTAQVRAQARVHGPRPIIIIIIIIIMDMVDTTGTEGECGGGSDVERATATGMGDGEEPCMARISSSNSSSRSSSSATSRSRSRTRFDGSISGHDSDTLVNAAFRYPGTRVERMEARRARTEERMGYGGLGNGGDGHSDAPPRTAYEQNMYDNDTQGPPGVRGDGATVPAPAPYGRQEGVREAPEQYDFYAMEQERERGLKPRRPPRRRESGGRDPQLGAYRSQVSDLSATDANDLPPPYTSGEQLG